jgi:ATP-binding protein involved in chromosome partitioning
VPILGIVENMAWFSPAELPNNKYYIFGKDGGKNLAEKYQIALLGQIPLVQSIRESGDEGKPVVIQQDEQTSLAFQQLAEQVAQQVAIRNAAIEPTQKVEIKV